jgi:hypothetical protein
MSAPIRPVVGFEGHYSVTNDGRVWSHKRFGNWLSQKNTTQGYMKVTLCMSGVEYQKLIHRLVAEAWIHNEDPTRNIQINHIDGQKKNNVAENLEWCTPSRNVKHSFATGLRTATDAMRANAKRTGLSTRALTPDQVTSIRRRVSQGELQIRLACEFGMSRGNMSQIINRRIYAEIQ